MAVDIRFGTSFWLIVHCLYHLTGMCIVRLLWSEFVLIVLGSFTW